MVGSNPTALRTIRLLDLSLSISSRVATYPGDPRPRIEVMNSVDDGGINLTRIILSAHTATHVDVPYHFFMKGKSVDELPLERFCGPAYTYDLTNKEPGARIFPEDVASGASMRSGEIALLCTRLNDLSVHGTEAHYSAYLDVSMADWLINKRVKAVGIDSMSVDELKSHENEVHKKLLKNEIVIFENLSSNLRFLVGTRSFFFGMPLRLERAEASPVRAFALV